MCLVTASENSGWRKYRSNKKLLVLLLTGFCLLVSACSSGPPRKPDDLCSVFDQKYGWQKASLRMQEKWNIPMFVPLAIMAQESSFRPKVRPPRNKILGFIPGSRKSSAYGYAQAIKGTWAAYIKDTGEYWRQRDDFVDALDFINWYISEAVRANGINKNDTYKIYLNYHEGLHGYRKKSYAGKKWLLQVSRKVEKRAANYASQYGSCKQALRRGWF